MEGTKDMQVYIVGYICIR